MPTLTRRQFLAASGVASLALAGCLSREQLAGDLGQVDGAWPMVGQNPAHTRRVDGGPTEPDPVWTTELPDARAVNHLALDDGRLYVPVDAVSETARHRYRVHALSAATGVERWQVPLRAEPNAPPAVSGDRIVVTARPSLERGRVVCFRKRYGGEAWLVDVDARVTAPPTATAGTVYVPDWRGRVHAISVVDGTVLWSRSFAEDGDGRMFSEPVAVHDGTLYVGSQSGRTDLLALDAATGEERWRVSAGAVTGGPVVADELVLVRSHHQILAFATDGTQRWSANVHEADARPMAVDDRHVYVPAHDTLYAIDLDGKRAWRYEASEGRVGTPTVAGEQIVLRGEDSLTALSQAVGERQWSTSPNGTGHAVLTSVAAFLPGGDGRVLALADG